MSDLEPMIRSELERVLPLPDGGSADWADVTRRSAAIPASSRQRRWRSKKLWCGRPTMLGARRRPLVLAVAVVAAAATAAAAWAILGSSAQETTSVECVIAGTDTVIPSTSGNPSADCAAQWQRDQGTAAPPLVAYDNGSGGVTVLPRSETPPAGFKRLTGPQDVDLIQLQDSLDDYINGLNSSCLDGAAATSLAQAKLSQFGFTGWTVTLRNSGSSSTDLPNPGGQLYKIVNGKKVAPAESTSNTRTCVASDIVEPATQTVTLIPVAVATGAPETTFEQLADKLRPLTQSCPSLPQTVSSVRSAASELGLSESARTYELNAVTDNSLHCASIYETVGGTIFITIRGPSS
jgi:hypothetical protein